MSSSTISVHLKDIHKFKFLGEIMSLLAVIEALRARAFPLNLLQSELREVKMPTARGWDLLLRRFEDGSSFNGDDLVIWEDTLTKIYTNHLRYGTKAVAIFPIEYDTALQLINEIAALNYTESPFHSNYPLPLATNELKETSFNPVPTSFEIEEDSDDVKRLVFCAKRAVKIREFFEFDTLEPLVRSSLARNGEIEELIVIHNRLIQSFDSVIIRPNKNRLEIHIDLSNPLNTIDLLKSIRTYTNKINELLQTVNSSLGEPVNFFPCIPKLYEEPDGYVHQLGHATGTASIKDEKMRGKCLDLRTELFHGKGLEAVGGSTNCFSIIKGWETDFGTPHVTITGRFAQAGMPDASVTHAIIDGCNGKEDFEMLLAKLI